MERMGLAIHEVDNLLQSVDETFLGTPFANPDGFDISSQLFASGRSLDEIPKILGTIADFTAHANTDLSRMGDMFVRVASTGRIGGRELQMMAEMGIPIATLAESMEMTVEELRDLASAGEFTSDIFFEAAGDIEMFQGAAQAMGTTTRGAFANVKTALAVLGDKFLSPLFGQNGYAVQAMQALREAVRSLYPVVEGAGEAFAEWFIPRIEEAIRWLSEEFVPAVMRVIEAIKTVIGWYKRNEETIRSLLSALGPAIGILLGVASATYLLRKAWRALVKATPLGIVLLLITALVYAYQNSETFRAIVTNAFNVVSGAIRGLGNAIAVFLGWVRRYSTALITGAGILLTIFFPALMKVAAGWAIKGAAAVVSGAQTAAIWLMLQASAIKGALVFTGAQIKIVAGWAKMGVMALIHGAKIAAGWILAMGPIGWIIAAVIALVVLIIANWETIKEWTVSIWGSIADFFINLWASITKTATSAWDAFAGFFRGVFTSILNWFKKWWPLLVVIFLPPIGAIIALWNKFGDDIIKGAKKVWGWISSFFKSTWDGIKRLASSVWAQIEQQIINPIQATWVTLRQIWNIVVGFLQSIWSGIRSTAISLWGSIKTAIITPLTAAWVAIVGIARNIWNSLKTAFTNALNDLKSMFSDWVSLGRSIISGIIQGINNAAKALGNRLKSLAKSALSSAKNALGISSPSKLFAEIGEQTMEGFSQGLLRGFRDVEWNLKRMVGGIGGQFTSTLTGPAMASAASSIAGSRGSLSGTTNITHGATSRSATIDMTVINPDNAELTRATQRALRIAVAEWESD